VTAGDIVREVIAELTGREPGDLTPEMTLRFDLGLDSFEMIELVIELEERAGDILIDDSEPIQTIAEMERAVEAALASKRVAA
jgi:acyl carrier protein